MGMHNPEPPFSLVRNANNSQFVGHVQTALMFKLRLFGAVGKHLTWKQRLVGISFDLKHLIQAPLALIYLALPFTLLCGYPFILWSDLTQLRVLIRLVSVHMLVRWTHQILLAVIARRINNQFDVRLPSYDTDLEQFISPCKYRRRTRTMYRMLTSSKTSFWPTSARSSYQRSLVVERRASHLPAALLQQWTNDRRRTVHLFLAAFGSSSFVNWPGCIYSSSWRSSQALS